jgi:hypothetical protein
MSGLQTKLILYDRVHRAGVSWFGSPPGELAANDEADFPTATLGSDPTSLNQARRLLV